MFWRYNSTTVGWWTDWFITVLWMLVPAVTWFTRRWRPFKIAGLWYNCAEVHKEAGIDKLYCFLLASNGIVSWNFHCLLLYSHYIQYNKIDACRRVCIYKRLSWDTHSVSTAAFVPGTVCRDAFVLEYYTPFNLRVRFRTRYLFHIRRIY